MDPEEIEFLCDSENISIIPTFNNPIMPMIAGEIGPFRASLPINVPFWIAIHLKQQKKCKIQPPDWMDVELLEALKEEEKMSKTFIKMPSENYMVETKLLLSHAADDIPRADELRTIIKDIWDIRMSKLRSSLDMLIKGSGSYASINHLTLMEINSVRPFLPHALDQLFRMKQTKRPTASQSMNSSSFLQNMSSSAHTSGFSR